jgi:hypothetical protein
MPSCIEVWTPKGKKMRISSTQLQSHIEQGCTTEEPSKAKQSVPDKKSFRSSKKE